MENEKTMKKQPLRRSEPSIQATVANWEQRVVSAISWRIFIINLAYTWLEKRIETVFEPNFSHKLALHFIS
jgi:hypothetical protein